MGALARAWSQALQSLSRTLAVLVLTLARVCTNPFRTAKRLKRQVATLRPLCRLRPLPYSEDTLTITSRRCTEVGSVVHWSAVASLSSAQVQSTGRRVLLLGEECPRAAFETNFVFIEN